MVLGVIQRGQSEQPDMVMKGTHDSLTEMAKHTRRSQTLDPSEYLIRTRKRDRKANRKIGKFSNRISITNFRFLCNFRGKWNRFFESG